MEHVKRIGIPQGFFYWQHNTIWRNFFHSLGIDIVVSGVSNAKIVNQGVKNSEDESCFSYKVFMGHILELFGKVDTIFLPTYMSSLNGYKSCPKFCGVAENIKVMDIKDKPKIFSPIIDLNKKSMQKVLEDIGDKLVDDREKIKNAAKHAWEAYKKQEKENKRKFRELMKKEGLKIVIFSHRYILEDNHVNFNIEKKLKDLDLVAIPIHLVPYSKPDNLFSWDFAAEEIARLNYLRKKKLDGVIQLSSFCCGPDSILIEYLTDYTKELSIPFLNLLIDEHTGEAGVDTRIEAFFDTVRGSSSYRT